MAGLNVNSEDLFSFYWVMIPIARWGDKGIGRQGQSPLFYAIEATIECAVDR